MRTEPISGQDVTERLWSQFRKISDNNFFTGGQSKSKTVGIKIDYIARRIDPTEKFSNAKFRDAIDAAMKPYTTDKGFISSAVLWKGLHLRGGLTGLTPLKHLDRTSRSKPKRTEHFWNVNMAREFRLIGGN
ncbi:hypothetical protein B0O99DRAFT_695026 [Bisporella sp. PMI_857]|nr:hypothetical protein B0O99DRAFT_695026 [Bisporella sp. PMI_857]